MLLDRLETKRTLRVSAERALWANRRAEMEARHEKHTPGGHHERRHWRLFNEAMAVFGWMLRLAGLYRLGVRNALDLRLAELEIAFADLPAAFDGYRILYLTDLHLDGMPELTDRAVALVRGLAVDGPYEQILPGLARIDGAIMAKDGSYAVLGNHDGYEMAEAIERIGISVLVNETATIARGTAQIHVTGTDDVHYYYTDAARTALAGAPTGFGIALVHSPELAREVAAFGHALYLAGHPHCEQVSLPGGRPILTHSSTGQKHAAGLWREGRMIGYTSPGLGVSGQKVRFNTRGEVTLVTLRSARA